MKVRLNDGYDMDVNFWSYLKLHFLASAFITGCVWLFFTFLAFLLMFFE